MAGYPILPHDGPGVKPELSSTLLTTLDLILNLSQQRGYCFASNAFLSNALKCNERTIRRRLADLVTAGYVRVYFVHGERHVRPVSGQCPGNVRAVSTIQRDSETLRETKATYSVCDSIQQGTRIKREAHPPKPAAETGDRRACVLSARDPELDSADRKEKVCHVRRYADDNHSQREETTSALQTLREGNEGAKCRRRTLLLQTGLPNSGMGKSNVTNPEVQSLIAEGVTVPTAQATVATYSAETLKRHLLAYRQAVARGKAHSVGWLLASLSGGWQVKVLDRTPESIVYRAQEARTASERFRVRDIAPPAEIAGALPDMSALRASLRGGAANV